jgi:hypothetical protein
MSNLYAFCATAANQGKTIIDSLPSTSYHNGGKADPHPERGQRLVYRRGASAYDILLLDVAKDADLAIESAAPSGLWDLWIMVADSQAVPRANHRWLARAWRYLLRESVQHPGYFRGPYSIAHVDATWPQLSALWLKGYVDEEGVRQPGDTWSFPHLVGDSYEDIVGWGDYRPTEAEIEEDTEWDPSPI